MQTILCLHIRSYETELKPIVFIEKGMKMKKLIAAILGISLYASFAVADDFAGSWEIYYGTVGTVGSVRGTMDIDPVKGQENSYTCDFNIGQAHQTCTARAVGKKLNIRSKLAEPINNYSPDNFALELIKPGKMTGKALSNYNSDVVFVKQ